MNNFDRLYKIVSLTKRKENKEAKKGSGARLLDVKLKEPKWTYNGAFTNRSYIGVNGLPYSFGGAVRKKRSD